MLPIHLLHSKNKEARIGIAMVAACIAFALLILTAASTQAATLQSKTAQHTTLARHAIRSAIVSAGCTSSNLDLFKISMTSGAQICYEGAGDVYPNLQGVKQFCSGTYSGYLITREFGELDFSQGLCLEPGGLFTIQQIHLN